MSKLWEKNKREILKPDGRLLAACIDLRYAVEHPNESSDIIMQQGIYRQKDPEAIMIVKVDGVEVGYKVKPCSPLELNPYFTRWIYVKIHGARLSDLTRKEAEAIQTTIMEVFIDQQQEMPKVEIIGYDAMLFVQKFAVTFPVAMNPNLVTKAGGVDLKDGVVVNG